MEQWQRSDGVILLAEDGRGQVVGFAEISIRRDHVEGTASAPVPYLEAWMWFRVIGEKASAGL
jgi:aminoglycoside 6'-N-acetyltransferase I